MAVRSGGGRSNGEPEVKTQDIRGQVVLNEVVIRRREEIHEIPKIKYVPKEYEVPKVKLNHEETTKYDVKTLETTRYIPTEVETIHYVPKTVECEKPVIQEKSYERPIIKDKEYERPVLVPVKYEVVSVEDLTRIKDYVKQVKLLTESMDQLEARLNGLREYVLVEEVVKAQRVEWSTVKAERIQWINVKREMPDANTNRK